MAFRGHRIANNSANQPVRSKRAERHPGEDRHGDVVTEDDADRFRATLNHAFLPFNGAQRMKPRVPRPFHQSRNAGEQEMMR